MMSVKDIFCTMKFLLILLNLSFNKSEISGLSSSLFFLISGKGKPIFDSDRHF